METNKFLLMDENKNFAIVNAVSLNLVTQYSSFYIKNLTTDKVIKRSIIDVPELPIDIPEARPIRGYNKMVATLAGSILSEDGKISHPVVTTIGYEADNGFKIPSERMLENWVII